MSDHYWIDPMWCIGCQSCMTVCPVGAIEVDYDGVGFIKDTCTECGACEAECPVGAIKTF